MTIAVYRRHYSLDSKEFESLKDAASFLAGGSDNGDLFPVGLYDADSRKAYVEEVRVVGVDQNALRQDVLADLARYWPPNWRNVRVELITIGSFRDLAPR